MERNGELKRYNIKPIRRLTNEEVEYIATEVTRKMEEMSIDLKCDSDYIYNSILKANIVLAEIPDKFTNVNYIYSTNTIYIRGEENITEINEVLFHEIFHYIQCNQDNNFEGELEQMGLCKFHAYNITGLAINEAAIQLIISNIFNYKQKRNNYWGLTIEAIDNNYYPVLCALLQQITYILGYRELVESLLKNTDDFKNAFEQFAGKKSYIFLRESFDKIMQAQDSISEAQRNMYLLPGSKRKLLEKKVTIYRKEIQNYFMAVQKLCYTEYFKPLFIRCTNKEQLEKLEQDVEKYHKHTGKLDEKDEFMIYTQKQLKKLKKKFK